MPKPTVATASASEIAEALLSNNNTKSLPSTACPACQKEFIPVRRWQKFCSTRCRTTAYDAAIKREINEAMMALIEENKELRRQLEELKIARPADK